jgi:hypothetical protein
MLAPAISRLSLSANVYSIGESAKFTLSSLLCAVTSALLGDAKGTVCQKLDDYRVQTGKNIRCPDGSGPATLNAVLP